MATVRAFQIPELKMWFWSYDHEPPRFHAKREGEWEVKVHFLRLPAEMMELLWADREPHRRILRQLARLVEEHRLEFLEEWEQIHGN